MQKKVRSIIEEVALKHDIDAEKALKMYYYYYEEFVLKNLHKADWFRLNLRGLGYIYASKLKAKKRYECFKEEKVLNHIKINEEFEDYINKKYKAK